MTNPYSERLHRLTDQALSDAEAGYPDTTPRPTRLQQVAILGTLTRIAVNLHRLDALAAAETAEAAVETPPAQPAEPAEPAEAPPLPSPPPPSSQSETETDMDAPPAEDPARMDALYHHIERQLERITGRRESRSRDCGYELIPAGDGGRHLAVSGPPGATSSGDG